MRTSRWRVVVYSLVLLTGFLTALPNLFTPAQLADWPSFLPTRQVALGLDLRGGSHLVLEIDTAAMIAERLEITRDDVTTALRKAHIDVNSIQISNDQVIVSLSDTKDHDGALDALEYLANAQVETPRHGSTAEFVITAPSDNSIHIALSEQGIRNRVDASAQQSLEIIRSRIDQIGVSEPTIQRIGSDRVLVQLPGVQDPSQVRKLLGSTAKLGFYMLADRSRTDKRDSSVLTLQDKDGQSYHLHRTPALSGDHLTDAHAGFDPQSHQPVVNFRFDTAGAAKFADITRANVGKPFAIVLDNEVLSAPVIREAITGGSGQISGSFTVGETVTLSALLRAGSLPAPMTVIEERTVGPDLGADAIEMGLYTGLIGLGLVTGLMFFL